MKKVTIGLGLFLATTSLFAQIYGDPMCPDGNGFCGPSIYIPADNNYGDYYNYPPTYQPGVVNSPVINHFYAPGDSYSDNYYNDSYSYDESFYGSHNSYSSCLPALYRDLKQGNSGEDVNTLQDFLHDAGYLSRAPNGNFGPATKEAVMAFQFQKRLSTTGTVGPMTRSALNEAICGGDADAYGNNHGSLSGPHDGRIVNLGRSYEPIFEGEVPTRVVEIPTTVVSSSRTNIYTNNVVINNPNVNSVNRNVATQVRSQATTPVPTVYNIPPQPVLTVGTFVPNLNTTPQTNIQYYPYDPFSNNPLPLPATLIIGSPLNNTVYNEGDTMNVSWRMTNANVVRYVVSLENSTYRISKQVAVVSGTQNSASFVLDKALLDNVCGGICDANAQASFKLNVVATISGTNGSTSDLKAYASPITVRRGFAYTSGVDIQPSKTPISSGEEIDLIVSTPIGHMWSNGLFGPFTISIKTTCPIGVIASVNGVNCGTYNASQNSIYTYFFPAVKSVITNSTMVPQLVRFDLTVTNSATGQVLGTDTSYVVVQKGI